MNTIKVEISNVQKAFQEAGDNPEIQKMLRTIYGDAVEPEQPKDIKERVKTYEDACRELGIKPIDDRVRTFSNQAGEVILDDNSIAYLKLKTIVAALNEGWLPQFTEDEYRYYPWFYLYSQEEIDDMNEDDKEDLVMMNTGDYITEYAGFACSLSNGAPSYTSTTIGSRLCLKNRELAIYCGKQFIDIWADYQLIKR